MKSIGLSNEDAQDWDHWRLNLYRETTGWPIGLPRKWPLKWHVLKNKTLPCKCCQTCQN